MNFDSDNIPDLPPQSSDKDKKVSVRKLVVACVVVAVVGAVMLPLLFWAFAAGWLEQLGVAFVLLLGLAFLYAEYAKSKRASGR